MKLLRASTKAQEFIKKLQEAAAGGGGSRPLTRDLLIAQRGPGELIGDMGLFSKNRQRQATVRCTSKLVARIILPDQLNDYLNSHTLARNQMRENVLKKVCHIMMCSEILSNMSLSLQN